MSGYGLTFKEGSWYFVGLDHTVGETRGVTYLSRRSHRRRADARRARLL